MSAVAAVLGIRAYLEVHTSSSMESRDVLTQAGFRPRTIQRSEGAAYTSPICYGVPQDPSPAIGCSCKPAPDLVVGMHSAPKRILISKK